MWVHFVLQGVFYGELFGELGLVLGTSLDPVTTYFIEPAFVNSTVRLLSMLYACSHRNDFVEKACSNHRAACRLRTSCLVTLGESAWSPYAGTCEPSTSLLSQIALLLSEIALPVRIKGFISRSGLLAICRACSTW